MADIKTLQTRIALKHDTWANWHDETKENQGANLVLLKGEIGFCEVPSGNAEATTAPTVLFKVGDGTTPFKTLKWASALAADVYGWAKASDVVLEGKSIKFVGAKDAEGKDKVVTIPYMTETEVKAITDPIANNVSTLQSDVADLKAKFSGDASVDAQLADHESRLDVLEGADTVEGSVAKALKDAKAYTDAREIEIKKYADQAEADALSEAKKYTDARETEINKTTAALAAKDAELAGLISDNADAIDDVAEDLAQELLDRAAADKAITDSIGTVAEGKTVVKMIEDAQAAAASDAEAKVKALADGAVATNTSKIAEHTAAIEALNKADGTIATINAAIAKEAEDRAAADALINEKFGAEYSKDNTIASAIADAKKAGTDAQGQVTALAEGAVATNAAEISRVEGKFDKYVEDQAELGHEARIAAMEAFFDGAARDEGEGENLKNALDTLKEIQEFATGEGTAAAEMLDAIDANAKAIKAVEDIVKDGGTLEVRVDQAEADIDAVEGEVDALQALTAGDWGEGKTIKDVVDAVSVRAEKGITDAKTADDKAVAADGKAVDAQNRVGVLEGVVGDNNAGLVKDAADAKADIAALKEQVGTETVAKQIEDAKTAAANDAAAKDEALHTEVKKEIKAVQDDLDALELVVGDTNSGLVQLVNTVKNTADGAAADTADLKPRMKTAEDEIDALQAIVSAEGGNSNAQLRADIEALEAIVVDGADGNVALGLEIDAVAAKVNNDTTGLVATKAIADDAKTKAENAQSRVAAIESDYLKAADLFIIDCGTSTTVLHEKTAN